MKTSTILRAGVAAALLAGMFGAGTALAADEPFLISMSGSGGRNARMPASVDGKTIYEHICQSCHMADGKGGKILPSTYPALAGNVKFVAKIYPAVMVVNGMGAMPSFGASLSDDQVAAVANYVRSNFGNKFTDAVTPAEVKALRPAVQSAPTELRGR
jgi:cytochrome c5